MQVSKELHAELLKQQGVLQKQKEELAKQLEVATSELGAIAILLGGNAIEGNREDNPKFPTVYNEGLTQPQAVYVSLYQINKGYAEDITKHLISLDPNRFGDYEKTKWIVTDKASGMYRKGIIGATKTGLKNRYFIKDK